ncbi:FAD dependent oxidoreductase-domain-containing protein [Annulohypoxylon bovei var. microspora]|nr:FAD dependent oxidoreductase-domain-containing protein [Annulohypoxylon bovei var. microspora]
MGAVQSSAKKAVLASKAFRDLNEQLGILMKRLSSRPGYPSKNPTRTYWKDDPPFPDLVNVKMKPPSNRAEVVIIGSGITAAAVAWSYLNECSRSGIWRRIIVLESRDLCGGATSRGGGHMKILPHEQFDELRRSFGVKRAVEIIRFQLSHIKLLIDLCEVYGWETAECREVETVDYFLTDEERDSAFEKVEEVEKHIPELHYEKYEAREAQQTFKVNTNVKGAMSYRAGAIHPYRFVSCVWNQLLAQYKDYLYIRTDATVMNVIAPKGLPYAFEVIVDELDYNIFQCDHVVHATNAFATELVTGLRGKLTGILGTAAMMKPGKLYEAAQGVKSWYLFYGHSYDYAMQRPTVKGVQGDVVFGGGFSRSEGQGASMLGVWDESRMDPLPLAHLRGIHPTIFPLTGDQLPFVGRLHPDLTGRKPHLKENIFTPHQPSEWICAGYNGDGLMLAWLCGTALGVMLTNREHVNVPESPGRPGGTLSSWFPTELRPSRKRVHKATLTNLGRRFFWALLSRRSVEPLSDLDLDTPPIVPSLGWQPHGDIPPFGSSHT